MTEKMKRQRAELYKVVQLSNDLKVLMPKTLDTQDFLDNYATKLQLNIAENIGKKTNDNDSNN